MSIQNPTPGLLNALKAAETGRLQSIKGTVRLSTAPFEELANLRPPSLNVPTTPGIVRLRQAFSQSITAPSPATRGLFEMVVKGAVSPAMIDYVIANKQTIADLRRDAVALRPQLENFPTPAWAVSNAALDMVATAHTFGDLADTQANRARAAGFIAERLAEQIAPNDRRLRPAIAEALLVGTLTQPTLDALGPQGVRRFTRALGRQLGLVDLMPGTHIPLLRTSLEATLRALRRHPGADANQLRASVRNVLRGRQLERFNSTHARALALAAELTLPAGPARPKLLGLRQAIGVRLGGTHAALTEAGRIDATLKNDLKGLFSLLTGFQKRADGTLAELTGGQTVDKSKLSGLAGQATGVVTEANRALDALRGRASGDAAAALGNAQHQLSGLQHDVNDTINQVRGVTGSLTGGLSGAIKSTGDDVRNSVVGNDQRTIEGNLSGHVQGEVSGSGHWEGTLSQPGGDPSRTEQLIGNALDAIPDIDKSFDARASFGGTIGAHAEGGAEGALGSVSYSANVDAYARGEVYARGGIKKDGDSLEAYGQAGFKVEAGVSADANFKASLLGGLVQADAAVSAVARAEAHADVQAALTVGRDDQGRIQLAAQAAVDVGASLEASAKGHANLNIGGMQIGAEGQAGVMVGFRANAHAEVGIKDGKFSIGAGFKLAFIAGFNLSFRLTFPVPKFITNFGDAVKNGVAAVKNGVAKIGGAIADTAKAVGNAAKAVGNFFSHL